MNCLSFINTSIRSGNLVVGPESSNGQCLKVRCKMSTLKPAAENSFCQLSSLSKSSDISVLFSCFSKIFFPQDIFQLCRFTIFFSTVKTSYKLSTTPSPRSSRPKSKDFLAFVGPWPLVSQIPYRTLHFTSHPYRQDRKTAKQSTKIHDDQN